jgi:hypothetical protein
MMKDRVLTGYPAAVVLLADKAKAAQVSARYNKTVSELEQELLQDDSLAMDTKASQLLYVCKGEIVQQVETSSITVGASVAEPPTENAFTLHSRPGSSKIIHLDFDGHVNTGSAWRPDGTITSPPYDIDGDFSQFSNTELANIM